ncbi:unnamed protein product [Pedinophyceae sp. YPF-701]|nr:unnamed protein product [Pedinophyceae sp. YPF-701]
MDGANLELASALVSKAYIQQGGQALRQRAKQIRSLLSERRLPPRGWDETSIETLLDDLAKMDSNNFLGQVGLGEREGRIACPMVARRNHGMGHGIGRSGSVSAEQPKAAGSSLIVKLCNLLATDALREAGLRSIGRALVLPMATGLTLQQVLLCLRARRPLAPWVIWPRVDQKTCVKCVVSAGLAIRVVPLRQDGDQLRSAVEDITAGIHAVGAANVLCVMTTTSCFAPRAMDPVFGVARLCAAMDLPHVVNNAYGVQSSAICAEISRAWETGRVDAVVQSTDKNFMVPVGGAIVVAGKSDTSLVDAVSDSFPGRAALAAHLDLLTTLLWWGREGWQRVLRQREEMYGVLHKELCAVAEKWGERVLHTPGNPISIAITLESLAAAPGGPTTLGGMVFARGVSGTRVAGRARGQDVAGVWLPNFGAHHDHYPYCYLTAAAALGLDEPQIETFVQRFDAVFRKLKRGPSETGLSEAPSRADSEAPSPRTIRLSAANLMPGAPPPPPPPPPPQRKAPPFGSGNERSISDPPRGARAHANPTPVSSSAHTSTHDPPQESTDEPPPGWPA